MYREIFVFVIGSTPQVVTETIYALANQKEPVYPDEIYIITTSIGEKIAKKSLIDDKILEELFEEYKIPPIDFTGKNILVLADRKKKIEDIRTIEDNKIMANFITSYIREKTQIKDSRLHCSLSGGRKTMGFYLGSAIQLFGRPQDRLYHILVNPAFENRPEFFYKPKKNREIAVKDRDGKTIKLNTRDAIIQIAEIPFIRLSGYIYGQGKSYEDIIRKSQEALNDLKESPVLTADLTERKIIIGTQNRVYEISFSPIHLAVYVYFLTLKKRCKNPDMKSCSSCYECFEGAKEVNLNEIYSIYKQILFSTYKDKLELDDSDIRSYITKINSRIKESVKDENLIRYVIVQSPIKQYGGNKYGVQISRERINIINKNQW